MFNLLEKAGAERRTEDYQADGSLRLQVAVSEKDSVTLLRQVEDATSGKVVPERC